MSKIKTWQERARDAGESPCSNDGHVVFHMQSELMDLRAALVANTMPEKTEKDSVSKVLAYIERIDKALAEAGFDHSDRLKAVGVMIATASPQAQAAYSSALDAQVPAQEQDKIDAQRYRFRKQFLAENGAILFSTNGCQFRKYGFLISSGKTEEEAIDNAIDAQLAQSADTAKG